MTDGFLDSLEYDENAPDVQSIMTQIRNYLAANGMGTEATPIERREAARFDAEVYQDLEQARNELSGLHATVYVAPSGTPVLGSLLDAVRRAFHRLVVYYVNHVADAQARINSRVLRVLTAVVAQAGANDQSEQVRVLEARVQDLESRVKTLEAALARPGTGQQP